MSIEICSVCNAFVDTDFVEMCYATGEPLCGECQIES